jgi:glucan phosphorylase
MSEGSRVGERGTSDDVRTGLSVEAFKRAYEDNLRYSLGRFAQVATPNDRYLALAHAVRDRLMDRWIRSGEAYYRSRARTVCYLSAEYLLGPHLGNNLLNLGVLDEARQAMEELGLDFDELLEQEEEPGLGNGGLGRLAACYMDSLATLQVPAIGYGIRYEFGIFDQVIRDGWQGPAGSPTASSGARPATPRSSAIAWATRTCCACGERRPPSRSTSRPSTWATTGERSKRRSPRRRSARSSTRTTSPRPAAVSAWPSSTSSCRARCRT